jgi:hypothetical protein
MTERDFLTDVFTKTLLNALMVYVTLYDFKFTICPTCLDSY